MRKSYKNRTMALTLVCLLVMALCSSVMVFAEDEVAPISINKLSYKNGSQEWIQITGTEITGVDVTKELTFQVKFDGVPAGLDNQAIIDTYLFKTNKIKGKDDTEVALVKESTNTVGQIKIIVAANTLNSATAYDIYFSADANGGTDKLLIDIYPIGVNGETVEEPVVEVPVVIPAPTGGDKTFADIKNHWAKLYIETMASKGITSGKTETAFAPDSSLTRVEFAAFMTRAMGLTEKAEAGTFSDVASGAWYEDAVLLAAKAGIINGYNGKFDPNAEVSRQDMAVMIFNAYDYLGVKSTMATLSFTDIDQISDYASKSIRGCVGENIMAGISNGNDTFRFEPKSSATRAEAMVVLNNFMAATDLN